MVPIVDVHVWLQRFTSEFFRSAVSLFYPLRICTVARTILGTVYYCQPVRLCRSSMPKQNSSHHVNVVCNGSPSFIFSGKQLNQNSPLPHNARFLRFSILTISREANSFLCLVRFVSETGSRPITSNPIPL